MQAKPCVITNHGLKTDAAVLALVDSPSSVGVCHGWESIAGPFRVTESQGNTIQSIDWRPAFDLYRSVLRQYGRVELTRDNFFAVARGYPFGIAKLSAERVVRGPVRVTPEGYLLCVGDLPEGCFVFSDFYVLHHFVHELDDLGRSGNIDVLCSTNSDRL